MRLAHWFIVLAVGMAASGLRGAEPVWQDLADPVIEGSWVRPPADEKAAKPVWGLADGLRIGLAPLPGPRGLLRLYTPYVGQPDWRMINFIAIEPIVEGQTRRGYSELEQSSLAEGTGKVMWSVDRPDDWTPRDPINLDGAGQRSADILGVQQPDPWRRELRERRTDRSVSVWPELDVRRDH